MIPQNNFFFRNQKILRKAGWDVCLNIVANLMPVICLQFIIQPSLANLLGAEHNGLYLTIISLVHFVVLITSSPLNSTRLLMDGEYKEKKLSGDFNLFLVFFSIINLFVIFSGNAFYNDKNLLLDNILVCLLSSIWMVKDYLIVQYRITLQYYQIFFNNILISSGFIVGLFCMTYFPHWQIIFIAGYGLGLSHVLLTTSLITEPLTKTSLFPEAKKKLFSLAMANILNVIAISFDRLFLYPIIGGTLVSVYYSSTVISKIMTLLSAPLSNVCLSYAVKQDKISPKLFNVVIVFSFMAGIIGYFICLKISGPLLHYLYPQWAVESLRLVPVTVGVAMFELIVTVVNPLLIRFCDIRWQIKIQASYLLLYSLLSLILLHFWGLFGFSIGVLFASIFKFIIIYFVGIKSFRKAIF